MARKVTTFGKLLKRLLKECDLTGARLASLAGLGEGHISLILSDKREPTARTLFKILKGAGKPWAWLDDNLQLKAQEQAFSVPRQRPRG